MTTLQVAEGQGTEREMGEAEGYDYVVVGGGVAGTCLAGEVCRNRPSASICLISPSEILKTIKIVKRITDNLDELTVIEQPVGSFDNSSLEFIQDYVSALVPEEKVVVLSGGRRISYGKLAICTGASPKVHATNPRLMTVRDTDSAEKLTEALAQSKRVIVAGNGAIALELVNKLRGVNLLWIVKHGHIGNSLLDVDVALFLLNSYQRKHKDAVEVRQSALETAGMRVEEAELVKVPAQPKFGHALGPKWTSVFPRQDAAARTTLEVMYNRSLANIVDAAEAEAEGDWPVYAVASDGERIGADVIVSCIGVAPNTSWLPAGAFRTAEDGGLWVNERMETSVKDVYAAGDVCTLGEDIMGPQFFQIRLWSQARMTAEYAAHCMIDSKEADLLDLGLDLVSDSVLGLPAPGADRLTLFARLDSLPFVCFSVGSVHARDALFRGEGDSVGSVRRPAVGG